MSPALPGPPGGPTADQLTRAAEKMEAVARYLTLTAQIIRRANLRQPREVAA